MAMRQCRSKIYNANVLSEYFDHFYNPFGPEKFTIEALVEKFDRISRAGGAKHSLLGDDFQTKH